MPTIEKRVSQGADDGYIKWNGAAWSYHPTSGDNIAGYYDSSMYKCSTWQLFRNITIPKAATILAAKLTYIADTSQSGTVVRTKVRAADEDNPTRPASTNDYLARPLTEALINWDGIPPWVVNQVYDSPDFKDVIQELVNRQNWQEGNAMLIFWDDRDDRSDHTARAARDISGYLRSPTKAPLLTIEYQVGPPPPTIETQDATNIKSTDATLHTKVIDDKGETLSVRHNYGNTSAYGMSNPWQEGKHTDDVISQTVPNLDPETEYHFRGEAIYED